MSWVGILIVVVAGYLALKAVGLVLKLLLWSLVLVGLYLVLAPMLGLPFPFEAPPGIPVDADPPPLPMS